MDAHQSDNDEVDPLTKSFEDEIASLEFIDDNYSGGVTGGGGGAAASGSEPGSIGRLSASAESNSR